MWYKFFSAISQTLHPKLQEFMLMTLVYYLVAEPPKAQVPQVAAAGSTATTQTAATSGSATGSTVAASGSNAQNRVRSQLGRGDGEVRRCRGWRYADVGFRKMGVLYTCDKNLRA